MSGVPAEQGQALGCSSAEDGSSLLVLSGRCCQELTPRSLMAVRTRAGPAEQCDFSFSLSGLFG